MANERQSFPFEQRIPALLDEYDRAQRTIINQIRQAMATGQLGQARNRRIALAAILRTLDDLGIRTDPMARQLVADAVTEAGQATGQQIGLALTGVDASTFAGISREAIVSLEQSIVAALHGARVTVGRQIHDEFARTGRRSTLQAVLGAQGSPRAAVADLIGQLRDRGLTSFVDRAGRQWGLDRYAEMVVRTTTRQAVVEAAKARMAVQGIRLSRVSTHASSCDICAPWEGRLVSLDGTVSDYHGEAVTDLQSMPSGGPPFHPNCRHTLMPVAEEVDALRLELAHG